MFTTRQQSDLVGGDEAALSYIENEQERAQKASALGLELDRELSDTKISVFYHPKQQRPVVVYRGTADVQDVGDDRDVLLGMQSTNPRFQEALQRAERAEAKYRASPRLYGHSLGGAKAIYVAKKKGYEAQVANPLLGLMEGDPSSNTIRISRRQGDVASGGVDPRDLTRGLPGVFSMVKKHRLF